MNTQTKIIRENESVIQKLRRHILVILGFVSAANGKAHLVMGIIHLIIVAVRDLSPNPSFFGHFQRRLTAQLWRDPDFATAVRDAHTHPQFQIHLEILQNTEMILIIVPGNGLCFKWSLLINMLALMDLEPAAVGKNWLMLVVEAVMSGMIWRHGRQISVDPDDKRMMQILRRPGFTFLDAHMVTLGPWRKFLDRVPAIKEMDPSIQMVTASQKEIQPIVDGKAVFFIQHSGELESGHFDAMVPKSRVPKLLKALEDPFFEGLNLVLNVRTLEEMFR